MLKQIGFSALSFIKAHKAQILIGAGIVGNAAATVIACKQTFTASSIIENHKFRRGEVEEAKNICRREIEVFDVAAGDDQNGKVYTEQKPCSSDDYLKYTQYLEHDSKRELLKVYAKTGLKFAKHYWLAAVLFLISNAAIGYGTGIMTRDIAGLSTALAGTTALLSSYRDRIKNVIGEEAERKIFNNEQVKVVTYKDVAEDGETEVEKEQAVITYDGKHDPYAILIDYHYHGWSDNIFTLLSNLKSDEIWANDELRKKLMPVAKAYSIEQLMKACKDYTKATSRRITFEYSLLAGVNDTPQCASELVKLLKDQHTVMLYSMTNCFCHILR